MPTQLFTDEERARLERFPTEVSTDDLNRFFRLTPGDVEFLRQRSSMSAWLVGGLQIGALRMLGFVPETLDDPGKWVAGFVADQLGVSASVFGRYTRRPETRRGHVVAVEGHLRWRRASGGDLKALGDWLVERALEHEGARALFELGCERLRAERVVRPGVTVLERLVAQARERAVHETALRLGPQLTDERCCQLDRLLEVDGAIGMSRHAWLRNEPPSAKPVAIKEQLAKLGYLRSLGADRLDLSVINPNRRVQLARTGRRATAQALAQMVPPRRYQILMAMLAEAVVAVTDEIVDLFDLALASTDRNARDALAELRDATAQAANDKVRLFIDVGRVILDPTIADADLRPRIYDLIGAGQLAEAVEEAERLARPADGNYFDLLEARYSQVRQYTPAVLAALRFNSNRSDDQLLAAVELLQELNARGRRAVPDDAPTAFASRRWQPYLHRGDGRVDRHHWELCVLTELRGALRAGNLWLEPSRRYADPTSYLIPPERWDQMRADTAALTGLPLSGEERLAQLGAELDDHLRRLDRALAEAGDRGVRVEDGRLVVPGIDADERPPEVQAAHDQLSGRLPEVDLPDLLVEVESWCPFLDLFTHAGGTTSRTPDLAAHLFAVIVTHACNLRLTDMARISGISYQQLAWAQDWYLRHDTLVAVTARIINFHHQLPITAVWGDGTLSSSDGQRFPVGVRTPVARGLPRYFLHRGLTLYTWTSDQHSQFGTKVIAATDREATHVLDAILDNETDLAIAEHTTDTAGYTDLIFGLFDLLGLRYSPRIRDIADTVLWRLGPVDHYPHAGPLLRGRINRERILERWDDLLRVAGSLKHGWVPASLLVPRMQASARQNDLTRAVQEYGRIAKTLSLLRYLHDPDQRRRVNTQLNKGESLHALRRWIAHANRGELHHRRSLDQDLQAQSLNLVTNAVVTWNAVYTDAVLQQLAAEGHPISNEIVAHLSPGVYEHVNVHGHWNFSQVNPPPAGTLRPLRPTVATI